MISWILIDLMSSANYEQQELIAIVIEFFNICLHWWDGYKWNNDTHKIEFIYWYTCVG